MKKKADWFKKGGYETVVFIPTTPNSILKKKYEQQINATNVKMKVVERRGTTLLSSLQKTKPLRRKCKDDCMVCASCTNGRDRNSKCRKENVTYEIVCKICQKNYVGETARNLKTRANEHDYKTSVMKNHFEENHKDQNPSKETVSIKVTATYKTALSIDRQISEGENKK